jgi:hypothetical protein
MNMNSPSKWITGRPTLLLIISRLTQTAANSPLKRSMPWKTSRTELIGATAAPVAGELNQAEPVTHLPASASAGAAAQVLACSLDDTLNPGWSLTAEPPHGKTASGQVVDAAPLILLAVAAWLQTRLQVDYSQETLKPSLEGGGRTLKWSKMYGETLELGARDNPEEGVNGRADEHLLRHQVGGVAGYSRGAH